MTLSPDTESVLAFLDEAIEGGLRKRNDVGAILELGASHGEADLINTITRTGTGLWKVYRTLRRVEQGSEGYHQLEQEFGNMLNELRTHVATLVNYGDDELVKRFDEVYFGMTQGVVRNLVDLGHDLARIKDLQRGT